MINGVQTANIDASLKETLLFAFNTKSEGPAEYKKCGFQEITSTDAYEEMAEYAGFGPAPRKGELAQMAVDVTQQGYVKRINQIPYAIKMPVSREAKKFAKYK